MSTRSLENWRKQAVEEGPREVLERYYQGNRNMLLYSDPTVDCMKTGHTRDAGYNLIASAKRPSGADD